MTRPPPKCNVCQVNRVAWTKPRMDFCYTCLPGGPFTPPPCRGCGSADYFSQGLCTVCHPGAPLHPGSCRGCLAWGVYRAVSWQCWSCRWWYTHYPEDECMICGRVSPIGNAGTCRLCLVEGRRIKEPGRAIDYAVVRRGGQQLYLANLHYAYAHGDARRTFAPRQLPALEPRLVQAESFTPVNWRQLTLFPLPPNSADRAALKRKIATPDTDILVHCDTVLREHAARHSWTKKTTNEVKRSLKLLQALDGTPGAKIHASDVLDLPSLGGTALSTLDILDAAGLLIDDRTLAVRHYFAKHTADLPPKMTAQLQIWLDVMIDGSRQAPRRRARHPQTAHLHILGMAPILKAWAAQGHQSLAEITQDDIVAALPARGAHRNLAEYGLRSVFQVLKSRKLVFQDPTRRLRLTPTAATIPMPLDTEAIRNALNSPDPACAFAVSLVAFHALTGPQLADLKLTDVRDGRLQVDGRTIPLAGPVRTRLRAYLDHRAGAWPDTINTHLFINRRTAPRTTPVSRNFPWAKAKLKPQALREDRILQEIHATGGDVRRICDLFGIGIEAALRYAGVTENTAPTEDGYPGSGNPRPR